MTIDNIFKTHTNSIAICMVDELEGLSEIEKFHKEFNSKFKIVQKEQWCVTLTSSEHIDSTTVQGPFESREIAEEFAKTWNQRRDEYIERTIEDDPDGDYEFNYIKAKAVELRFSPMNEKLLDEILNKETKCN